jgi:hypothetical protein
LALRFSASPSAVSARASRPVAIAPCAQQIGFGILAVEFERGVDVGFAPGGIGVRQKVGVEQIVLRRRLVREEIVGIGESPRAVAGLVPHVDAQEAGRTIVGRTGNGDVCLIERFLSATDPGQRHGPRRLQRQFRHDRQSCVKIGQGLCRMAEAEMGRTPSDQRVDVVAIGREHFVIGRDGPGKIGVPQEHAAARRPWQP